MKSYVIAAAAVAALCISGSAFGQTQTISTVPGFGTGATQWTSYQGGTGSPIVDESVLYHSVNYAGDWLPINNTANQANAGYFNTPVNLTQPFTASFNVYGTGPGGSGVFGSPQTTPPNSGITLTLAAAKGLVGSSGAGLGWGTNNGGGGIPNSVAMEVTDSQNIVGGESGGTFGLATAGPTGALAGNYHSFGGSDAAPVAAYPLEYDYGVLYTFTYDGVGTLTESAYGYANVTDDPNDDMETITQSYAVNIASVDGSTMGYLAITGGDGSVGSGLTNTKTLMSPLTFTTTAAVPEPTSLGLLMALAFPIFRKGTPDTLLLSITKMGKPDVIFSITVSCQFPRMAFSTLFQSLPNFLPLPNGKS